MQSRCVLRAGYLQVFDFIFWLATGFFIDWDWDWD